MKWGLFWYPIYPEKVLLQYVETREFFLHLKMCLMQGKNSLGNATHKKQ